jgi:hypothetical protein
MDDGRIPPKKTVILRMLIFFRKIMLPHDDMVGQVEALRTLAPTGNTAIIGNSITNINHVNIWRDLQLNSSLNHNAACSHPEYRKPWEKDTNMKVTQCCAFLSVQLVRGRGDGVRSIPA